MRFSLGTALSLLLTAPALAQGPENVLVVANKSSAASLEIARYYAERRHIPVSNVCTIDAPAEETISREVYDRRIAGPVSACLKSHKLIEKVLYIVTTLGVPLRIRGTEGMGGDQASIDSELAALYQDLQGQKHELRGPLRNPFYAHRDEPFTHPRFPVYLVCRLAGYGVAEAKALVDRSLAAADRGKVVLDLSSASAKPGNEWLRDAAILLPRERVVLDETPKVLYGLSDVIGYAGWGSNDPDRKERFLKFRWLPGAIVTEFVSSDARTFQRPPDTWNIGTWKDSTNWWVGSPQTLTADYIHEGATGASGHTYEPYLTYTPRPDYLFPAYLGGRNLAESFYLSIPALSWQNVVVGDPLCRLKQPR